MITYLEKFKQLPEDVRMAIAGPQAMANIKAVEAEFGVSLATVIMRVMVRDIAILDLPKFFVFENNMDGRTAEKLSSAIKERILPPVWDFLGIATEKPAPDVVIAKTREEEASLEDWIQKRKKETEAKGSSFFFSTEDEEEVRKLAKKIETFKKDAEPAAKEKPLDFDVLIGAVAKELSIVFSSEDLQKRFYGIMSTYLKGIRNKIDTKLALSKGIDQGGMGFAEIYADNIILVSDRKKSELTGAPAKPAEKPQAAASDIAVRSARDQDYDFKNMPKLNTASAEPALQKEEKAAPIPPAPAVPAAPSGASEVRIGDAEPNIEISEEKTLPPERIAVLEEIAPKTPEKPVPAAEKTAEKTLEVGQTPLLRPSGRGVRQKIEDVKQMPRLTGPLDELKGMDLVNFRRLGRDAKERTAKILDKIEFLEEENYGQRLAGIRAWRQSPVNGLYLQIGRQSIGAGKGINDIIKEMGDSLTEEEFMAVMELNRRLRY